MMEYSCPHCQSRRFYSVRRGKKRCGKCHQLKVRGYLRYADDFLILASAPAPLYQCIESLRQFLSERLNLELHPKKIILRKLAWGIDFLGYIVLPHYRLPRTKTKRRIFKKAQSSKISDQSLASYLGYFCHAQAFKVEQELKNLVWFIRVIFTLIL